MATTKSTVVGIRLDHERRAWVEAEAARLGVSVRGLFEGMIDEARSEEVVGSTAVASEPASNPTAVPEESAEQVTASIAANQPRASAEPHAHAGTTTPSRPSPTLPSVPGIGLVTGIPGDLIRGAFSLTANFIESSGHCAASRLGNCALTRHWYGRSL